MKLPVTKISLNAILYFFSALLIKPLAVFAQTPSAEDYRKEYEANWGLAAINADAAYKIGITGKDVAIGIVDYGIDPNHPEFKNRSALFTPIVIKAGGRIFDGGKLNPGSQYYSHGMHVGGTIAADKNGAGMHGVAYDSDIISAKTLLSAYAKAFSSEMSSMHNHNARAINHSWTAAAWKGAISNLIQDGQKFSQDAIMAAISLAAKNEIIQVWALGNEFLEPVHDLSYA